MVETMRSIAALLALTADNTSGDVSPEDLRDVITSLKVRYGSMHISSAVETVISAINTPTKVLGTTTLGLSTDFDMPVNGRLRYTGAADFAGVVVYGASITGASSNQDTTMWVYKDAAVVPMSEAHRKIGTGSDIGRAVVISLVDFSTNDYVEAFIENDSSSANITYTSMTMMVFGGTM